MGHDVSPFFGSLFLCLSFVLIQLQDGSLESRSKFGLRIPMEQRGSVGVLIYTIVSSCDRYWGS